MHTGADAFFRFTPPGLRAAQSAPGTDGPPARLGSDASFAAEVPAAAKIASMLDCVCNSPDIAGYIMCPGVRVGAVPASNPYPGWEEQWL